MENRTAVFSAVRHFFIFRLQKPKRCVIIKEKNCFEVYMKLKKRNWKKIILISLVSFFLANIFVIMPVVTVVVYESIFHRRYEQVSWLEYEVSEFEGLRVEETSFPSDNGQILAGYHYFKDGNAPKGVVVLAHGLGCGGHNMLMPFADFFTSHGYLVFAYDATANGKSEGNSVKGLPQGVADLDYALQFVKTQPRYGDLPVFLLGHSWGAYSTGAVLNFHPDVAGVVLLSGPNQSLDLMVETAQDAVGFLGIPEIPYLMLYETLKFGKYAGSNVVDGLQSFGGNALIVHSIDDDAVPIEIGYDVFYEKFASDSRFEFIRYEDKGHDYVFCSEKSEEFRAELNQNYTVYVESHGGEYNGEIKEEFMNLYLDKPRCFELDSALCTAILQTFEKALKE